MKIYDCFMFFNELEILKLRLQELYNSVDYFVIVEANKTVSGKNKEFIYEKNKNLFKKWENKIIYIKLDNMPSLNKIGIFFQKLADWIYFNKNRKQRFSFINKIFPLRGIMMHFGVGRWKNHVYQKNGAVKALKNCEKDDIILISDLDEIPNYKKFPEMIEYLKKENKIGFIQREFNYYLNGLAKDRWLGTRACKFEILEKKYNLKLSKVKWDILDSKTIRSIFGLIGMKLIENGGGHFSYIGNAEKIKEKFESMAGSITLKTDINKINEKLRKGEIIHRREIKLRFIPIDNSFPEALIKNKNEYENLIKKI